MRIRRKASRLLGKMITVLNSGANWLYQPAQIRRVIPWFKDRGDQTLRLDYDLDENSMVFDLGGYEGQWTSDIFARYCCSVHLFEPVAMFATLIEQRFRRNRKIQVHRFGLAARTQEATIGVAQDGSSLFKTGERAETVRLVRAADFLEENSIKRIDLMKINIEGGEYDLLEHLVASGAIVGIGDVQVQFHDFVDSAETRMRTIQNSLAATHDLTYQYPFVWENWRNRSWAARGEAAKHPE